MKEIRRQVRWKFAAEEEFWIVPVGPRQKASIAEPCWPEGIAEMRFAEAPSGVTKVSATTREVVAQATRVHHGPRSSSVLRSSKPDFTSAHWFSSTH
jgi:hypothetical protein